jgi:hypothetical protein
MSHRHLYDTKDIGGGFSILFYVEPTIRYWHYRLVNVEHGVSIESGFPFLTMEYCIDAAVEAAIDVLSSIINCVVEVNTESHTEVYAVFTDRFTGSRIMDMIVKLYPQKYYANLVVFKVLLIIKEGNRL